MKIFPTKNKVISFLLIGEMALSLIGGIQKTLANNNKTPTAKIETIDNPSLLEEMKGNPLETGVNKILKDIFEKSRGELKKEIDMLAKKHGGVLVFSELERQTEVISDEEYEKIRESYKNLKKDFESFVKKKKLDKSSSKYKYQIGDAINEFFKQETTYNTKGQYGITFKGLYELSSDGKYQLDCDMFTLLASDLAQKFGISMKYNDYPDHVNSSIGKKVYEWTGNFSENRDSVMVNNPPNEIYKSAAEAITLAFGTTNGDQSRDGNEKELQLELLKFKLLYTGTINEMEEENINKENLSKIDINLGNFFIRLNNFAATRRKTMSEETTGEEFWVYMNTYKRYNKQLKRKGVDFKMGEIEILHDFLIHSTNTIIDFYNNQDTQENGKFSGKRYRQERKNGIISEEALAAAKTYERMYNASKIAEGTELLKPEKFNEIIEYTKELDKVFNYKD